MNQLKILSLKFSTICKKDCKIHQHMGNTLRGALGNALITLNQAGFLEKDIYNYIFKNQTEQVYVNSFVYGKTNPFVIDCDYRNSPDIKSNESLNFSITLFGNACDFGGDIIKAVKFMLVCNIANNIDCFDLLYVEDSFTNRIYYKNGIFLDSLEPIVLSDTYSVSKNIHKIKISFVSPVVIKSKGKLLNFLKFEDFFGAVIRRLVLLCSAYGDGDFSIDMDSFNAEMSKITVANSKMHFFNFDNYSRTIDNNYPRKGLSGFVEYEGDLNMFMPYIIMGSSLHVGKGATIGMGKYFCNVVG